MTRLSLFFALCVLSVIAQIPADSLPPMEWGDIEIEGKVSKDSLPQNDTLDFTVRLKIYGNPDDYAIADPANPPVSNLTLVGTTQANRTAGSAGGEIVFVKEYRYSFVPTTIGMAYINPTRIQYVFVPSGASRTISTGRLEIKITEPVFPPKPFNWMLFIIIAAAIGVVAFIAYIYLRRMKAKREAPIEIVVPPEDIARTKLREFLDRKTGDNETIIEDISRVLGEYIEQKYRLDYGSYPIHELLAELEKKAVPGNVLSNLRRTLELSAKIRFAGQNATQNDVETVALGLESFISFGERKAQETAEQSKIKEDK